MNIFLKSITTAMTRRAAFDIGSGATKLIVADVGLGITSVISNVYFGQERPCAYGADWLRSSDGSLSISVQNEGRKTFSDLKKIAEDLGAKSFTAIATEVFRKASNGQEYINGLSHEMGVPIRIVTQEEEAQLGYATGLALKQVNDPTNSSCLVWDSGGASFQITYGDPNIMATPLQHYVGAFGSGISMKILVETVQKQCLKDIKTPNPISSDDANALIENLLELLPRDIPDWLRNAKSVTAIGGLNSVFFLASTIISSLASSKDNRDKEEIASGNLHNIKSSEFEQDLITSYTATEVRNAITHCINKDDSQLVQFMSHAHADPPSLIVPKLALLLSVMLHTGIERVDFVEAIGSCPGVLISEEYWQ